MTAPTPEYLHTLASSAGLRDRVGWRISVVAALHASADTLAAVTGELDHERTQHEATKSALDQAWTNLHQARLEAEAVHEMHEDARKLAGTYWDIIQAAPHDDGCGCTYVKSDNEWVEVVPCTCWKAEVGQ